MSFLSMCTTLDMRIAISIPRFISEFFKALYVYLISQFSLLSLLVDLLFALLSNASGNCIVKHLSLIVLDKFLWGWRWGKTFTLATPSQIK